MFAIGEPSPNVSTQECVYNNWREFCVFTIGEHWPNVYTQKCLKIKCVSLTFRAHCQNFGERCGEVCYVMGVGEGRSVGGGVEKCGERCGEVCWGVGEVRKDVGRGRCEERYGNEGKCVGVWGRWDRGERWDRV